MKKFVCRLSIIIALGLIIYLAIVRPYRVSGDCMDPAIKDGSLHFLNRTLPYLRQYKIGDIVVFKHEEKTWVSRVVALENDTVQISEGGIMLNDTKLQDNVRRNWTDWKYGTYGIDAPIKIPSDHVYVASDNLSAHHDDSRIFGPIPNSSILGILW